MSSFKVLLGVLLVAWPCAVFGISQTCLHCICKVESNCNVNVPCGDGGRSCGPYQIQYNYWSEGGRHGRSWGSCVRQWWCAEETIRGYMNRYATYQRLRHTPTCEDFARIHNGGPNGYRYPSTLAYWRRVQSYGCNQRS